MARTPSVILTPAEKKLAVSTAKDAAKSAKVAHSELAKARAKLEKDHAAALKLLERNHREAVVTATKTFNTAVKESDKAIKLAAAAMTKADADLIKLVPPVATAPAGLPTSEVKAVPTPTE